MPNGWMKFFQLHFVFLDAELAFFNHAHEDGVFAGGMPGSPFNAGFVGVDESEELSRQAAGHRPSIARGRPKRRGDVSTRD